jgi:hypothetical protein
LENSVKPGIPRDVLPTHPVAFFQAHRPIQQDRDNISQEAAYACGPLQILLFIAGRNNVFTLVFAFHRFEGRDFVEQENALLRGVLFGGFVQDSPQHPQGSVDRAHGLTLLAFRATMNHEPANQFLVYLI